MLKYSVLGTGVSCWSENCILDILTLEPDGEIYNCPELRAKGLPSLGNISDFESLEDLIFNIKRLDKFVSLSLANESNCEYYSLCHRGCPSSPHKCEETQGECKNFFEKLIKAGTKYADLFK